MKTLYFPSLYQINTRVWMTELSADLGHQATLDDIPDSELDKLAVSGFDWIWLLSIWQTGMEGRRISRENPGWRNDFRDTLSDLKEEDIEGSGFAITSYKVHAKLGGDEALARLRDRMKSRGLKLMLDFVPNHTGMDHEWVFTNPEYYIKAGENDILREPDNFTRIHTSQGEMIIAHGRDPFFPGWPDTIQLNYGNPALQEAMTGELIRISGQCDGVRCDMAMLLLPEVFERTWGRKCKPFWPEATRRVREIYPDFRFLAEVYWDMEWSMIQQGFDYAYDKRLYDRLKEGQARAVREHFSAGLDYQCRMVRFLENHDEPRVSAEFSSGKHEAAAILTYLSPGLRFFHQGQSHGSRKRISPHLIRAPYEAVDSQIEAFYVKLLEILKLPVFRSGNWKLLECTQAWEGNRSYDRYIVFSWLGQAQEKILVAVNYSPVRSQCYIKLPFSYLENRKWKLSDLLGDYNYEREGNDLYAKGLYLDEPGWRAYVFSLQAIS